MRFATNLFNVLNIQAGAAFDPYDYDFTNNQRIDRTMWDAGKGFARFRTANASVGGSLRSITDKKDDESPGRQNEDVQRALSYGRYSNYVDFNIPWNLNFSYNIQINKQFLPESNKDTVTFNHMSMFSGDVNITPRWKLTVSSGYNFGTKELSVTEINIYRDLHCWEMRLGTVPFGPSKNFNFTLNVKAQILQDLRLIRRRDFRDALQ